METKHIITIVGLIAMISVIIFAVKAMVVDASGSLQTTGYNTISNQNSQAASPGTALVQSGKQVIQLSMKNGNYYPNTITLKKGIPAVLEVDLNTVKGCYRGIKIPAFGVQQTVTTANNKIEFTPDKAGTFGFSCYMGMGTGKIVVEDETGNVPASVNTVAQDIGGTSGSCGGGSGGSCGSSGGGCGCGAR